MYQYLNAFTNRSGDALPGYFARLFDAGGNVVDLFADSNGTPIASVSGVANAALSDGNGMFRWFVANGTYDMRFYDANDVFVSVETGVPMFEASQVLVDLSGDDGATLVGTPRGNVQKAIDGIANLREYGADGDGSPLWAAVEEALSNGFEVLRLPYVPGESNIAYFETFTPADLVGCTLDIDPRITLSLPSNEPASNASAKLIRYVNPPNFYFRSLSVPYSASRDGGGVANDNGARRVMPYVHPKDVDRSVTRRVLASALTPLKCGWPNSDSWSADSFSDSSASSFVFSPANDGNFHMGFRSCQPGDEFSISFAIGGTPADLAALVRHTGGFAGVLAAATYNSTVKAITKTTGVTGTETNVALVGPGTHETYSGLGSVWTIRIDSWTHFTILWNGLKVRAYETPGKIEYCGFGARPNAASQIIACQNQTRRFGAPTYTGQFLAIRSYGDSTLQARYDDCPTYLEDALDLTCGIRNWKFTNRAVGGDGVAAQLALMQADYSGGSLAEANVVLLQVGVNDQQALTNITQFRDDFEDAIQLAHSVGATVIIGLPPLFYTQDQAGSRGQAAVNYGRGAPYNTAIRDLVAQYDRTPSSGNGPRCILVDLPALDGPVVANYVNNSLTPNMTASGDPVDYDNIHPTTETNKRRADAYARAIASAAVPYSGSLYLPTQDPGGSYASGASASGDPLTVSISADGIVSLGGYITLSPVTDNEVIYRFPRPFWPKKEVRVSRPFSSDLSDVGWLRLSTAGELYGYGFTNSTYVFVNQLSGYCIEDREAL